jgi:hypothetical protein
MFVLVSVTASNDHEKWRSFEANVKRNAAKGEGTRRLDETVWLIDLENDALLFSGILQAADSFGIACQYAFLPESPKFITL